MVCFFGLFSAYVVIGGTKMKWGKDGKYGPRLGFFTGHLSNPTVTYADAYTLLSADR